MGRVVTSGNKLRQRHLDQRMAAAVKLGVGVLQIADQRTGDHHIAQTQAGIERFTEGADIDHRRVGHQPLQGGDGLAGKAKLAVIIIFDDPAPLLAGERQQPLTTFKAHHCAQRILVRGGDKDEPRRIVYRFRRTQAVGIDGQGLRPDVIHRQQVANAPVGRLLHPRQIAAVAQHAGDQIDSLVDPLGDKNLICLTVDAARYPQIIHQRLLQLRGTAVAAVAEPLGLWPTADARLDLAEQRMGKGVNVRYAGNKRSPLARAGADLAEQVLAAA